MAHFYAIWGANFFETFCDTFILPKTASLYKVLYGRRKGKRKQRIPQDVHNDRSLPCYYACTKYSGGLCKITSMRGDCLSPLMPFERSGYFRGASRRGAKKEDHPFGWSSFLVHQSNPNSNPFPPRPRAQRSGSRPKKEKGPRPAQFAAKAGNGAVRGPFERHRAPPALLLKNVLFFNLALPHLDALWYNSDKIL
jgi:hypothetical protein